MSERDTDYGEAQHERTNFGASHTSPEHENWQFAQGGDRPTLRWAIYECLECGRSDGGKVILHPKNCHDCGGEIVEKSNQKN
jgi:hypothetical protein